jgi:2-keto-4-pentenoate hydratase
MDSETASAAARYLGRARLDRVRLDALSSEITPPDEYAAYTVQDALHVQLSDAGMGTVSGHKIGCTTPIMQSYLNIDSPCAGGVFEPTAHHKSGTFEFDKLLHPGVECELAVRLRADLVPGDRRRPVDRLQSHKDSFPDRGRLFWRRVRPGRRPIELAGF